MLVPADIDRGLNVFDRQKFDRALVESSPFLKSDIQFSIDPSTRQFRLDIKRAKENGSFVGGTGITNRSLGAMDIELTGLIKRIAGLGQDKKIVFLGNGLSDAALDIVNKGWIKTKPVIVDILDYRLLQEDFMILVDNFNKQKLPVTKVPGFWQKLISLQSICMGLDEGTIEAVQYVVGSENPPEQIKDADLVINCNGPNSVTQNEQLFLLKPGGELWTVYPSRSLPVGYNSHQLLMGYKVTKKPSFYSSP